LDVRRTLARERISTGEDGAQPVTSAAAVRSMAELIRQRTMEATGGRTYAEIDPYVDELGKPTADAARAARDELTGRPVERPEHKLWIESTTLQTALIQAYVAFRISELTIAVGAAFLAVGLGLAGRRTA
jgi:hypothetical protein